jgi:hypothetical protein
MTTQPWTSEGNASEIFPLEPRARKLGLFNVLLFPAGIYRYFVNKTNFVSGRKTHPV